MPTEASQMAGKQATCRRDQCLLLTDGFKMVTCVNIMRMHVYGHINIHTYHGGSQNMAIL